MALQTSFSMSLRAPIEKFLVRYFCPDARVESVTDIDLELLRKQGCSAMIMDLDNTLVGWRSRNIAQNVEAWLKKAERLGYKRHIVSNSLPGRVGDLGRLLGIPFISRAVKPRKRVFEEALTNLGSSPAETVVIGDQLFTDVLGGKRMGLRTILVSPVDKHEFFTTLLFRIPERALLASFTKRGLLRPLS